MYTSINFKTKKALKEAIAAGKQISLFSPGVGTPKSDGREFAEGPQGAPHTWYAEVEMKAGIIVKVK